jgi:hypothetical protein
MTKFMTPEQVAIQLCDDIAAIVVALGPLSVPQLAVALADRAVANEVLRLSGGLRVWVTETLADGRDLAPPETDGFGGFKAK